MRKIKSHYLERKISPPTAALKLSDKNKESEGGGLIQDSAKRLRPGLVNFTVAVAYHFCLSLPTTFSQPGRSLLAGPCKLFCDDNKSFTMSRWATLYIG